MNNLMGNLIYFFFKKKFDIILHLKSGLNLFQNKIKFSKLIHFIVDLLMSYLNMFELMCYLIKHYYVYA